MIEKILLNIGKNLNKAQHEQVWFVPKTAGDFWGGGSSAISNIRTEKVLRLKKVYSLKEWF